MSHQTMEVMGMTLPVIAELSGGYYLVAHPNGPAIATPTSMCTVSCIALDADTRNELGHVAVEAIEAYEDVTWPALREKFYPEETDA